MRGTFDPVDLFVSSDFKASAEDGPADPARHNRHRGLRSFLTRAFFLGQIVAFEHFFGGKAQAGQASDDLGTSARDGDASGPHAGSAAALQATGGADETGATAPTNTIQATAGPGVQPPAFDAVDVPSVAGAQAAAGASSLGSGTVASATGGSASDSDAAIPQSPVIDPAEGGHNPIGTITEPVLDLVDDLGQTVEQVLDSVEDVVDDVVALVDDTVDTVVATVHETLDTLFDVLHTATSSLPLVGPVLGEVTAALENVVSPTLEAVTSTVTGVVDVVADTLTDATDILPALGDVVGSGVIPAVTETVSNVLNPDTLFADGKYTDLNITLQSEIVEPVGGVVSTAVSVTETLLGGIEDLATGDHGPAGDLAFGVTSLINDTTKGGLAELFS
jgi:hypothetical protein